MILLLSYLAGTSEKIAISLLLLFSPRQRRITGASSMQTNVAAMEWRRIHTIRHLRSIQHFTDWFGQWISEGGNGEIKGGEGDRFIALRRCKGGWRKQFLREKTSNLRKQSCILFLAPSLAALSASWLSSSRSMFVGVSIVVSGAGWKGGKADWGTDWINIVLLHFLAWKRCKSEEKTSGRTNNVDI